MDTADVLSRWEQLSCDTPDVTWRKEGGVRLLRTSCKYGVREDGEGRLFPLDPTDIASERDESEFLQREAHRLSLSLAEHMLVPRTVVIGKGKTLQTQRARAANCQCRLVESTIEKPSPFVTYETPSGRILYRTPVPPE